MVFKLPNKAKEQHTTIGQALLLSKGHSSTLPQPFLTLPQPFLNPSSTLTHSLILIIVRHFYGGFWKFSYLTHGNFLGLSHLPKCLTSFDHFRMQEKSFILK